MMRRIQFVSRQRSAFRHRPKPGFTLVEMLIAMAITLVMIGAVVTLFANISNSVRNRRAVVEMSGQLRHARNMLQQDLQGVTCPGLTWQRPDENQGYIEIIEGPLSDRNPSAMIRDTNNNGIIDAADDADFDLALSILPRNNAVEDLNGNGRIEDSEILAYNRNPRSLSPGGIGDHDDILMLTVRNEHEPFVGKIPKNDGTSGSVRQNTDDALLFPAWDSTSVESPLAEVVWYAIENPDEDGSANGFFGEPGLRTIYRRTLLIAPWLNPYRFTNSTTGTVDDTFQIAGTGPVFTAQPGLLRILSESIDSTDTDRALAALIAFQDRYDISARLEFDPLLDAAGGGRWKIVANTLGDLTKRENRYEHHQFAQASSQRVYPYAAASSGSGYAVGSPLDVQFIYDSEQLTPPLLPITPPEAGASAANRLGITGTIVDYSTNNATNLDDPDRTGRSRPFVYVDEPSTTVATPRAMLNDKGAVIRITHSLVPLWGERRGEDVMLTDALGFDLRVYDPGAPLFGHVETETVLDPTSPAWWQAYTDDDNMDTTNSTSSNVIGNDDAQYPFIGQGAYVDLGYGFISNRPNYPNLPPAQFATTIANPVMPWFFQARALSDVYGNQLAPGYAVYDTWSFHYENNGLNEDNDEIEIVGGLPTWQLNDGDATGTPLIDEGTNGLDDVGSYSDGFVSSPTNPRLGPDDVGERETIPPYDKPLRGVQVLLRLYERDSRQVRQVSVNQSLVPE